MVRHRLLDVAGLHARRMHPAYNAAIAHVVHPFPVKINQTLFRRALVALRDPCALFLFQRLVVGTVTQVRSHHLPVIVGECVVQLPKQRAGADRFLHEARCLLAVERSGVRQRRRDQQGSEQMSRFHSFPGCQCSNHGNRR